MPHSVLRSLISFREVPWKGLVYYVQVYYYNFIEIVSYVYLVYNLRSYSELSVYVFFVLSRDTLAYVYLLIFYFDLQQIRHFICPSSQNSTYFTNFESISLWYFVTHFFTAENNIYNLPIFWSPIQSKHWKTGRFQGSDDFCKGDCDSYLSRLTSLILSKYTTVTNQC